MGSYQMFFFLKTLVISLYKQENKNDCTNTTILIDDKNILNCNNTPKNILKKLVS